ncbi:Phospholipase/carboxylesterase/thioesterase [Mycena belliarum]|uniref:Acyl-protein thioesterase 1 n=1 Tax=Mycena belliarum TaxID=1033014 RepID=A0AAD6XTN4_9AGAR|nr:Phospholipase/carboxylesterase/thioesterase [Mycena belliae]
MPYDTPNANMNQVVVIPATQRHTASVIFIHGLGQNTFTWRAMIMDGLVPRLPHVEWVLPQASSKPVTYCQGMRCPSWFNIATLPPGDAEFDEPAIAESIRVVESLIIAQIHRGVDSRRIILVGFSQGAALALMVALSTLHDLGGVASLSGWIPPRAQEMVASPNVPILWCHGAADPEIPIVVAANAVSYLRRNLRDKIQYKTYLGLSHTINDEEVNDLLAWLVERNLLSCYSCCACLDLAFQF